jgi:phospholipid/cholesterol/gamma-HCH transport system substrate-binding protein
MRRTRADLIRVGLFVTVAGSILVGSLLWLAGAHLFRPVSSYTIVFERSVTGLNVGANVEYQGVVIGRVRDVRLTADIPPKVAVLVDVEPTTPIRTDITAALIGSLVTGIKYIELRGGTAAAPPLGSGGTIPGEVPSLADFQDRLMEIAERVTDILAGLQENVFTPTNAEKFRTLLSELTEVAGSLNRTLETFRTQETGKGLTQLIRRLGKTADTADAVLSDFYRRRETVYGGVERSLRSIDATARAAGDLVRRADSRVEGTGRALDALIQELTVAVTRLEETTDVIRSDPALLLWGRSAPERERAR